MGFEGHKILIFSIGSSGDLADAGGAAAAACSCSTRSRERAAHNDRRAGAGTVVVVWRDAATYSKGRLIENVTGVPRRRDAGGRRRACALPLRARGAAAGG